MDKTAEDLKVRTKRFATGVLKFVEFTARLGIVLDESDESELWLSIANDSNIGNPQQRVSLAQEAGELRAIFSKAYTTARERERGTS